MLPVRACLALIALSPIASLADIHYTLAPLPKEKAVDVTIAIQNSAQQQQFKIPAWCPGFYFLENFQNKIDKVAASDSSGATLTVGHPEARTWTVTNPTRGPMVLHYRVKGDDPGLGFFGVSVKPDKAFTNGAATFMYLPERLKERDTLDLKLPEKWNVATPMDSQEDGSFYSSTGYDEFIDHPIQMGEFTSKSFTVKGIPFQAVYVAPDNRFDVDLNDETERLKTNCASAVELFGAAAFKRYTFFFHFAVGDFDGGLEHRASCVLAVPNRDEPIDDLTEHEFFHAWNVKQIRPKPLGPFDYTQPDRTHNLWFAEGVTDYYAKLLTYRSGLGDEGWLFKQFGEQIAELQQSQTRLQKSLEDASWEAWENGGFGVGDLSFYTKGFLVGLIFDAEIRAVTNGSQSLDDVMRYLYAKYHLPLPGYGENDLLLAINEVSGHDFTELYNLMVRSTKDLPYRALSTIGLRAHENTERVLGQPDFIVERDPSAGAKQQKLLQQYLTTTR